MRRRFPVSISRVPAALAFAALAAGSASAQPAPREGERPLWENSRIRVRQVSVAPGSSLPAAPGPGRVLVYLTAGPDGAMPAEAVWQGASEGGLQNGGKLRVEALAIEVKDVAPAEPGGTPPELLMAARDMQVSTVVDNPRVLVTRHRYASNIYLPSLHFHDEDVLVVYLRGGHMWPVSGSWADTWDSLRVRRGDVDVIPANTFHTLANAGGDPLEFLLVFPR